MIYLENEDIGKIVSWRAKEWAQKQTYISYEDLLSVGYMAITKALKKYDESRGTKITTYIAICIDNAIKTAITKEAKHTEHKTAAEELYITKQEQDNEDAIVRLAIQECLDEEEQQIVHLYFYQRKTLQEIAKVYNTNHVQVHRRLEKIKLKLREGLIA